ncbi:hypothetical protein GCM10007047_03290 [Cerasicoccus arenae]|uniref:Uncharacterized protein n=2 Tax=Cerasicoccus arenae TaxID=424488 RepID=A0A8J3GBK6_9BACT|nr:hypothetical protein GCM10007047_03290 [Cerasicoccus arenae]
MTLALLLVGGCVPQHKDAIVFATNTVVGVKVGTNSQQIPEIQVGYTRQEGAFVPLYVNDETSKELVAGQLKDDVGKDWSKEQQYLGLALVDLQDAKNIFEDPNQKGAVSQLLANSKNYVANFKAKPITNETIIQYIDGAITGINNSDTPAAGLNIEKAIRLIQVELDLPIAIIAFNPEAKYTGTVSEKNRTDAYSVLGTFSGDMNAKSKTSFKANNNRGPNAPSFGTDASGETGVSGGIAQYFATGIAAQIMAEKGGAALVNSGSEPAAESASNAEVIDAFTKSIDRAKLEAKIQNRFKALTTNVDQQKFCSAFNAKYGTSITDGTSLKNALATLTPEQIVEADKLTGNINY